MIEHFDLSELDDRRKRHVAQALAECTFDFGKVGQPIKVVEIEYPQSLGRMGHAEISPPEVNLNVTLMPKPFRRMLLEEVFHIVDPYCMTDEDRNYLLAAAGCPAWRAFERDPETGKNKLYAHQGSESFAHQWAMKAFSPHFFDDNGWPYPPTRKVVRAVKEILG